MNTPSRTSGSGGPDDEVEVFGSIQFDSWHANVEGAGGPEGEQEVMGRAESDWRRKISDDNNGYNGKVGHMEVKRAQRP